MKLIIHSQSAESKLAWRQLDCLLWCPCNTSAVIGHKATLKGGGGCWYLKHDKTQNDESSKGRGCNNRSHAKQQNCTWGIEHPPCQEPFSNSAVKKHQLSLICLNISLCKLNTNKMSILNRISTHIHWSYLFFLLFVMKLTEGNIRAGILLNKCLQLSLQILRICFI